MRFLLVAILLVGVILAGCETTTSVYTFKKDRVDQRMEGNRGYVVGTPPPEPVVREVPKRTMIGVDVEIPVLPGEEKAAKKKKAPAPKKEARREEDVIIVEEEIVEVETTNFEPKREAPKGSAEVVEVEEEEWIK